MPPGRGICTKLGDTYSEDLKQATPGHAMTPLLRQELQWFCRFGHLSRCKCRCDCAACNAHPAVTHVAPVCKSLDNHQHEDDQPCQPSLPLLHSTPPETLLPPLVIWLQKLHRSGTRAASATRRVVCIARCIIATDSSFAVHLRWTPRKQAAP